MTGDIRTLTARQMTALADGTLAALLQSAKAKAAELQAQAASWQRHHHRLRREANRRRKANKDGSHFS